MLFRKDGRVVINYAELRALMEPIRSLEPKRAHLGRIFFEPETGTAFSTDSCCVVMRTSLDEATFVATASARCFSIPLAVAHSCALFAGLGEENEEGIQLDDLRFEIRMQDDCGLFGSRDRRPPMLTGEVVVRRKREKGSREVPSTVARIPFETHPVGWIVPPIRDVARAEVEHVGPRVQRGHVDSRRLGVVALVGEAAGAEPATGALETCATLRMGCSDTGPITFFVGTRWRFYVLPMVPDTAAVVAEAAGERAGR